MQKKRRGELGASAVEFAIIAPLFFMITFGAITGALAYDQRNQMTHAAREGARYGATLPLDTTISGCTMTKGRCWATHLRDVTIDRAFGTLDAGVAGRAICVALVEGNPPTVVTDYREPAAGGACYDDTTTLPAAAPDPGRRVQVVVAREGRLNAVLFQMTLNLTSEASARHEEA